MPKKLGLVVAMPEEAQPYIEYLGLTETKEFGGFVHYQGKLGENELTLILSSIGPINAAVAATELMLQYPCEHLINIGSCGANHKTLQIGDIVSPAAHLYGEFDLTCFGYQPFEMKPFGQKILADADGSMANPVCFTYSRFVSGKIHGAEEIDPQGYLVEMESYAIAAVAKRFDVPFTSYKIVSDNSDDTAQHDFDKNLDAVMKSSTKIICDAMLAKLK